jgi:hypothetical protein
MKLFLFRQDPAGCAEYGERDKCGDEKLDRQCQKIEIVHCLFAIAVDM